MSSVSGMTGKNGLSILVGWPNVATRVGDVGGTGPDGVAATAGAEVAGRSTAIAGLTPADGMGSASAVAAAVAVAASLGAILRLVDMAPPSWGGSARELLVTTGQLLQPGPQ